MRTRDAEFGFCQQARFLPTSSRHFSSDLRCPFRKQERGEKESIHRTKEVYQPSQLRSLKNVQIPFLLIASYPVIRVAREVWRGSWNSVPVVGLEARCEAEGMVTVRNHCRVDQPTPPRFSGTWLLPTDTLKIASGKRRWSKCRVFVVDDTPHQCVFIGSGWVSTLCYKTEVAFHPISQR